MSCRRWTALAAAVLVGGLIRSTGLADALDHDEIYTWEAFASRSYAVITTHYPVPNNHIFHSALVRLSSQVLGESEAALRVPAFVAGLLAIPAAWVLARVLLLSSTAAVAAAWLLALAPTHIRYSASARGYTITVLLAMVALLCLWQGVRRHASSWWWLGWASSAFLAVYTLPSAALFIAALSLWATIDMLRQERSGHSPPWRAAVASGGAVLLAVVGAYWPIRAELARAGQEWGVDLADPGVLAELLTQSILLSTGGWEGAAVAFAAVVGFVALVRGRGDTANLAFLVTLIAVLPFAACVVYGTAPQPRGFVFLLPVVVLLCAHAVTRLSHPRLRLGALVVLLVGYAYGSGRHLSAGVREGCRPLGQQLVGGQYRNQVVVAPYIMDLEVWHYGKEAIRNGLVTAAINARLDRVVFAADSADPRFGLDHYLLSAETTGDRLYPRLPQTAFEKVYSAGTKSLHEIKGNARRVFRRELTWRQGEAAPELRIAPAAKALSNAPALQVSGASAFGDFRLHSTARFEPGQDGLAVLLCARTDQRSEVSLYRVAGQGDHETPTELHMGVTAAKPVKIVGHDGQLWYLEAFVLPVLAHRRYGLYIRGGVKPVQGFAELAVYYFPWSPGNA